MFFNIFLNDLFYVIKEVKLHAYADDEQLYDSDSDPIALTSVCSAKYGRQIPGIQKTE